MFIFSSRNDCADKSQDQNQMMGEFGGIGYAGMKNCAGDYFHERKKRQQENS